MANGSERGEAVGYGTRLHQNLSVLAELIKGLEPDLYSGSDARRLTELFAWGERLCAMGKALAAKRVVDTGAWEPSGERTAADWLGRVSGQTAGQAAEAIETVKRMRDQPKVEEAARAGTLSPEQGSAVTSAAQQAPDKADELLDKARSDGLRALRDRAKEIKWAADEKAEKDRDRKIHAGRYLRTWSDLDGSGRLTGRFTPEALAVIQSALQPFQEEVFTAARRAASRERRECHAADALVAMARCATGQDDPPEPCTADSNYGGNKFGSDIGADHSPGTTPACAGSDPGDDLDDTAPGDSDGPYGPPHPGAPGQIRPTTSRDGGPDPSRGEGPNDGPDPSRRAGCDGAPDPSPGASRNGGLSPGGEPSRRGGVRTRRPAAVIVRIDHAALVRGYREADECCEIDGVGLVSVATVRAMMTDAFLAAVVTDGVDIRSVVHLGRSVTAAQRTALLARDPECVVPGCHVRFGLEIDHVADWAATKVTTIDRLARLCHHHHAQKTREGWQLEGRPGRWRWIGPHGRGPDPPFGPGHPDRPSPAHPMSPAGPGDRHDEAGWAAAGSLFDPAEEPFPP